MSEKLTEEQQNLRSQNRKELEKTFSNQPKLKGEFSKKTLKVLGLK